MNACSSCRAWLRTDETKGQCRRYAPQPQLSDAEIVHGDPPWHVVWPISLATDWCAEFIPQPIQQTPAPVKRAAIGETPCES